MSKRLLSLLFLSFLLCAFQIGNQLRPSFTSGMALSHFLEDDQAEVTQIDRGIHSLLFSNSQ